MVRKPAEPCPEIVFAASFKKPVGVKDRETARDAVLPVGEQDLSAGEFKSLGLVDALVEFLGRVVSQFAEVAGVADVGRGVVFGSMGGKNREGVSS